MKKLLSEFIDSIEYTLTLCDGTPDAGVVLSSIQVDSLVFDSRHVKPGSLFFALPGTHTTGNKFIANAVNNGAVAVVYEGDFTEEEKCGISEACSGKTVAFIKVNSSRFAMSPLSASFYDNPSKKLVVYGVTGTEGKSSTVAFIWQLLRLAGYKAGFISTVQYSLGGDAIANPEHQTTPEAPIVQRELHEMLENGCTHAVVESSSHGLSEKTNRLGDVLFDCGAFMNVTLEHLEFHGTYEQYKSDKANLFRALDRHDHMKSIAGKETQVASLGIVNLEDPAATYFAQCTGNKVIGFTTEGKAGKNAEDASMTLPEIPAGMPCCKALDIASTSTGIVFELSFEGKTTQVKAPVPGAFNAYNIMTAILAVSGTTGKSVEELAALCEKLESVKGRMTVVDEGQPFEVIVDYAHTPSSFETIFPPVRKRCSGKMICVFGSGGERDTKKRPMQGEIAARFCDYVILANEDPRGEDEMALLEDIAVGSRKAGKKDGENLFLIPDRPAAIRKAFSLAKEGDIVLLLGKSHENSIIFKDHIMPYDEISEAKKALEELK
ncbi:MAG: UDP-N-acetylmuramoyl-L-alanyl-D-glutamate--2,6-diaminopimelate ligase [Treponema sp.]|nr:UDP-N-acetylmuramoyl-L-alanyl-D-glutamate--2,6-diaminopimelate ligase [Candidatus Treponema equi]